MAESLDTAIEQMRTYAAHVIERRSGGAALRGR